MPTCNLGKYLGLESLKHNQVFSPFKKKSEQDTAF